ncbi:unnamed protein product, partial [Laminaria digitata]
GRGTRESVRFERRAQMLRAAARMLHAKREKNKTAEDLKLLKAVQGRLGDGGDIGGALVDIGGENGLVRVAPKEAPNRKRSGERSGSCAASRHGGGCGLGETGLSDDGSGGDSDTSSGSSSSGSSDNGSEAEGDDVDRVMAAFSLGRVQEDSDSDEVDEVEPEEGREKSDDHGGSAEEECDRRDQGRSIQTTCASSLRDATPNGLAGREVSPVSLGKVPAAGPRTSNGGPPSPHNMPVEGIRNSASGKTQRSRLDGKRNFSTHRSEGTVGNGKVAGEARLVGERGVGVDGVLCNSGGVAEHASTAKSAKRFKSAASGGGDAFGTGGGGSGSGSASASGSSKREISESSPAAQAASAVLTPSDAPASGGTSITSGSAGRRTKGSVNSRADDRTMRTPVRTPPESGASSFLYEAKNTLPALIGSADDNNDNLSSKAEDTSPTSPSAVDAAATATATAGEFSVVGPAFAACRATAAALGRRSNTRGGVEVRPPDAANRDVFSGGPAAMAEFSSAWRRSRCFSFVVASRSLQW